MKPRIKCYEFWSCWWYEFPDKVIARMDAREASWTKTWQDLYENNQVPFLFF